MNKEPATHSIILCDEQGEPRQVIVPDYAYQMEDPAFNPPGMVRHLIPKIEMAQLDHKQLLTRIYEEVGKARGAKDPDARQKHKEELAKQSAEVVKEQ